MVLLLDIRARLTNRHTEERRREKEMAIARLVERDAMQRRSL